MALTALLVHAQQNDQYFTSDEGVAIKGYDVVAYHTQNKAVKGSAKNMAEYDGAKWYFSSKEHAKMFKANPDKYLPRYGGYCAFAMAKKNARVPVDPETFTMMNGELYLFFNGETSEGQMMNTKPMWDGKEDELKPMADENWSKMQ